METMYDALVRQVSAFVPRFLMSVLTFLGFWLASVVLPQLVRRLGGQRHLSPDVLALLAQIAKTALLIVGGVTALGTVGINIAALVAGLGLTGFALGFACKDILSNLLAGMLLLIYRPFQRQDRIAVLGFEGVVGEIGLRYTVLHTEDRTVLIPNANLFTNPVSVFARQP
jgi:small conductance mechanosensitive channel